MGLAFRTLLLIVSFGPTRARQGVESPFVKGLSQEFRTAATVVDPALLPTAFDDRGNAAITLQFVSGLIPSAICSQSSDEARHESGSCPRERIEKGKIGMLLRQRLNLPIVGSNRFPHLL